MRLSVLYTFVHSECKYILTNGRRFIPYSCAPEPCLCDHPGVVFVPASSLLSHELHVGVAEVVGLVTVVVC